jgi:hypothetical protein
MRQAFITTVKQMDPIDVLVLNAIRENGNQNWNSIGRDVIARELKCSIDEVLVSFAHLAELDCIFFTDSTGPRVQPFLKPFGTLLMNAVSV